MATRSVSAALFFHAGQVEREKLRHAQHSEQRSKGREHPGSSGSAEPIRERYAQSRTNNTRPCNSRSVWVRHHTRECAASMWRGLV
jgi:hypothetical protein